MPELPETEPPGGAKPSDQEEPTLPEVVVRPDEEPGEAEREPARSPFDLPLSYPSLADETIGIGGFGDRSIFEVPESATVRTRRRLDEMAPANTPKALEEEVGVIIQRTNPGGGSPFVRGLTGNMVLILVDGIRLNNSTFRLGPNQYLNTIDPGQIRRIEVIRGPSSVLYGSDAIGGVINIVTRSARSVGSRLGSEASFMQRFSSSDTGLYSRLNVEANFQRSGVFAGGSYLDLNDLDAGGSHGRQPYTGYEQSAADVKFDYLIGRSNVFTIGVQHLVQHDVPRTDSFVNAGEAFIFDPQQRELYYVRLQGSNRGGLFDAYRITASFNRQQEGRHRQMFGHPVLKDFIDDVQTTGVNVLSATDLGILGRLTYGFDWYHDELASGRVNIDTNTGAVTPGRPSFPPDTYYGRFGMYLQEEVDLTGRLRATGGVRYTNIQAGSTPLVGQSETPMHISPSFQDWCGQIGLVYQINPCINLVGSVSEGFRAPGLDDLTALRATNQGIDVPSPGLDPETSWNYEVGLKFDNQRLRGQIFGFWTYLDGLIVRQPAGYQIEGLPAYFKVNAGKARIDGLELAGEYLLRRGWSIYGNYTYTFGQNTADNEPVSRIPPAQGIAGLRWRSQSRSSWFEIYEWMAARQDRLSARDVDDPRIPPGGTPGYHTLNLRAGRFVGDNSKLALGLENILDRHYRVHASGIDAPGITFTLGYELSY